MKLTERPEKIEFDNNQRKLENISWTLKNKASDLYYLSIVCYVGCLPVLLSPSENIQTFLAGLLAFLVSIISGFAAALIDSKACEIDIKINNNKKNLNIRGRIQSQL